MSFLGRESEGGFHGEDSGVVALENDSVDGRGLSETLVESPPKWMAELGTDPTWLL